MAKLHQGSSASVHLLWNFVLAFSGELNRRLVTLPEAKEELLLTLCSCAFLEASIFGHCQC